MLMGWKTAMHGATILNLLVGCVLQLVGRQTYGINRFQLFLHYFSILINNGIMML